MRTQAVKTVKLGDLTRIFKTEVHDEGTGPVFVQVQKGLLWGQLKRLGQRALNGPEGLSYWIEEARLITRKSAHISPLDIVQIEACDWRVEEAQALGEGLVSWSIWRVIR